MEDEKFLDTVFGIGKLSSNILSVVDGENLTADRDGHQIYGTIKLKDEKLLTLTPKYSLASLLA